MARTRQELEAEIRRYESEMSRDGHTRSSESRMRLMSGSSSSVDSFLRELAVRVSEQEVIPHQVAQSHGVEMRHDMDWDVFEAKFYALQAEERGG